MNYRLLVHCLMFNNSFIKHQAMNLLTCNVSEEKKYSLLAFAYNMCYNGNYVALKRSVIIYFKQRIICKICKANEKIY